MMEEVNKYSITTLLWELRIPMAIILLSSIILFGLKKKRNKRYKLPPGRRGWPLIGDSISWYKAVSTPYPSHFVHQQANRYGKVFSCSLFGKWTVVSTDPTFNRFVMQNEGKLFQSNYPKSFRDLVGKNGVITMQGEQQRKLHAIASNLTRIDKLNSTHFLKDIQTVILQILNNFHNNQVILLQDVCRKIAINLMVNQLLGVSSESEVNEMAKLFSDFVDGCLSIPINFPGCTYYTAMKAREKIVRKIKKMIENHRSGDEGNGVLGRLVNEENLEDEAIADFIINLLFAGNETTAKAMLLAVYFLTQCPKAIEKLLDEHDNLRDNCVGDDELLSWQHYKAMPFTQSVIDETLRLGGVAIWLMREAKEDVTYQEYIIPKGCPVIPFLSAVHLDENIYQGALTFNPWRWTDPEYQEKRNWRNSNVYTPFGGGARLCPGAELARLQIALFLHYFVTKYRWIQLKVDELSFFPSARLLNGFQIQLMTRHEQRKPVLSSSSFA